MLQPSVFDMYVNAGANAIRILQRLLGQMGYDVAVDGVLGPQTIGAVRGAMRRGADAFVDAYGIARRNYYFRLADRRPASRKYARNRAGGKGDGSSGRRSSSRRSITSARRHFSKGFRHGVDRAHLRDGVWR